MSSGFETHELIWNVANPVILEPRMLMVAAFARKVPGNFSMAPFIIVNCPLVTVKSSFRTASRARGSVVTKLASRVRLPPFTVRV